MYIQIHNERGDTVLWARLSLEEMTRTEHFSRRILHCTHNLSQICVLLL